MRAKRIILLGASISLMTLWGCSSSMDSDGGKAGVDDSYLTVGIDICVQCHDIKGQEWLGSRHGNAEPEGGPHSPHRPGESSCADCHNPLNDGDLIEFAFNTQEKRRDVIGCESCHGGGGLHYGLGPIEYPKPAPAVCGECHNRDDGHHDTEEAIYDRWAGSRHADSLHGEDHNPCQRCHTNEGALAANVAGYTGDADVLGSSDDLGRRAPEAVPEEEVGPVSCATCHDVHKAGELRQVWSSEGDNDYMWDPNENGSNNDQFDLCTSCHVLYNDEGILVGSGTEASGTAPFYHNTAWFRMIGSTHYDDPATGPESGDDADATIIEGYNIRWQSDNPCFDCHGHEFRTATRPYSGDDTRDAPTIWTDWSSSAHAAHLFEIKLAAAAAAGGVEDAGDASRTTAVVDAVYAAGVTNPDDAWLHYNWDRSGRAGCQRCHTATGASNFMDATAEGEDYDAGNNDYSHLAGWSDDPAAGSPQNEMLYCWGCHVKAADGILRNPGPITEEYDPAVIVEYPDINGSNVCMTCHLGRETGEVVKTKTGFDDASFVNSHYLAAGGTVFGTTGYHFSGRSYSIPASDTHDNIGLGDTGNAVVDADYTNGPCATCHFGSVNRSHSLSPFTQYSENDLALNPVCVNCHTSRGQGTDAANTWFGKDFTIDDLVAGEVAPHRGRYIAAIEALYEILADNGYYFQTRYPYFFNGPSASATAIRNWTVGTSTNGMNNMGAAFNFNLLEHDPGGVAHNRRYTRRLIYDSIDHMDDGSLNYSVAATLNALSDTTSYKASAISYLLQAQNGNSGDRY